MPGHWSLRTFLELGALPGAVPCARLHARLVAWEWGLAGLGDDAELLVSELLTNAVAASRVMEPIFPVRLWLVSDTTQIAILVWDANPQPPVPAQLDDQAETGRGLLLVEAVSQQWGWYAPQDTTGKVVWALTRRPGALCPDRAGRGSLSARPRWRLPLSACCACRYAWRHCAGGPGAGDAPGPPRVAEVAVG
jgi:anti-sigma regulatory factor (Ser/Thr protein kinase)